MSSSPRVLDNEEIEFLLAQSATEPAEETVECSDPPEESVTMRGDLDRINLADIFQMLAMSKTEGMLRISNPLEVRRIHCKDGMARLMVAERAVHRRIGQRLVHAGHVTPRQLRAALMTQRKAKGRLGEILIEEGALTAEGLEAVLHEQAAEDMFAVFTWQHGSFEFFEGPIENEGLRRQLAFCPEFEVSSLLLEVARRADEWTSILDSIGTLDEVPVVAAGGRHEDLGPEAAALLHSADGTSTYRELAERSAFCLFDIAHAARDLVQAGHLTEISDGEMIALARARAESGEEKRAIMLLQTLRERPGSRDVEVVRGIADLLATCGERRAAGLSMLEQAQQQSDPELALAMAREACTHAPQNAETLSFLRTILVAHAAADSEELKSCTLALLDALIEDRRLDTALEIVTDARATGTADFDIRMREVRLRQRMRDVPGAVTVLDELAEELREGGDRDRLVTIYETILKLDRSRVDVRRHLVRFRRTRVGRIVRVAVFLTVLLLVASVGVVFWMSSRHAARLQAATDEVAALLAAGDRLGARERLSSWAAEFGPEDRIDDLRRRIDFADAEELRRAARMVREDLEKRLAAAGEAMWSGDLEQLFAIHREVRTTLEIRAEADELLGQRLDLILTEITNAATSVSPHLPEEADPLAEPAIIESTLRRLHAACPPKVRRLLGKLAAFVDRDALPEFLPEATLQRVRDVVGSSRELFARVDAITATYTEVLERQQSQREYDPMFKEALLREQRRDFAGALELFRRLEKVEAASPELRLEFTRRIARNELICSRMTEIREATEQGRFRAAADGLAALEAAIPEVPFRELVRLPLQVTTRPAGATLRCDGEVVGVTPCRLAYVPAQANELTLELDGYERCQTAVPAEHDGALAFALALLPTSSRVHGAAVDRPPTVDVDGRTYVVDRSGTITAFDDLTQAPCWTFESRDLSGLLGEVTVHGDEVVFPSLDGTLRALDRANGSPRWSVPGLPTEVSPARCGDHLLLATADDQLVRIHLGTRAKTTAPLPDASSARFATAGDILFVATREGLAAWSVTTFAPIWQRTLATVGERFVAVSGTAVVTMDDGGVIACFDAGDGTPRWSRQEPGLLTAAPILDERAALVVTETAAIRLDLADGSRERAVALGPGHLVGRPTRCAGKVLVRSAEGRILVLDPATATLRYCLRGGQRGTIALPWRDGALVALPDRTLRVYRALP